MLKSCSVLTYFIGLSVLPVALPAVTELNPPELVSAVSQALECAYRQEFDEARVILRQLLDDYPDNPAGYFFLGALEQLYMFDVGSDSLEPLFDTYMTAAETKARAIITRERNPWAHLYLGAVYTYRAIYHGWKGNYWETYRWGSKAPTEMNRALALDKNLTDACLALGVNEYFRYAASRYLTGLPVFGSYQRSIALIQRAERSGYFGLTARYAHAWIAAHERAYDRAEAILCELLDQYPGNRLFRKLLRDTYFEHRNYDAAIAIAEELDRELCALQPDNAQAQAENYLTWAKCLYAVGDRSGARRHCDSIISFEHRQQEVVGLARFVRAARDLRRRT